MVMNGPTISSDGDAAAGHPTGDGDGVHDPYVVNNDLVVVDDDVVMNFLYL